MCGLWLFIGGGGGCEFGCVGGVIYLGVVWFGFVVLGVVYCVVFGLVVDFVGWVLGWLVFGYFCDFYYFYLVDYFVGDRFLCW